MTAAHPHGHLSFQGKDPQEQFRFYFRQHWIRLLWPFTRTVLLSVLIGAAGWTALGQQAGADATTRHILTTLIFALFCAVQFQFLMRFYRYFLYVVIVSDRSVHRIKKTLLTMDDHENIDLAVLQDIHKSQHGVIQNMLGFGTLYLEAQDTHLRIHFTPHISARYHELMQLRQAAMRHGTPVVPGQTS